MPTDQEINTVRTASFLEEYTKLSAKKRNMKYTAESVSAPRDEAYLQRLAHLENEAEEILETVPGSNKIPTTSLRDLLVGRKFSIEQLRALERGKK